MTTADDVRMTRERLGWTQQQLADKLGVSLRAVQYWEKGDRRPPTYLRNVLVRLKRANGKRLEASQRAG